MIEVIFLLALAFIWILIAAILDAKTTEIPNWLTISLIIFALGFRFFYSLFSSGDFNFFLQGLIGFGIFFLIGNALYYGKMFAGGDAKLLYAIGPVIFLSNSFLINVEIGVSFLFLFLASGSIYGIIASIYFSIKNFKDFKKELKTIKKSNFKINLLILFAGLVIMILGLFYNILLTYLGIIIFAMPLLYIFTKSVDETMTRRVMPSQLMEGDWLYEDVKIGNKTIKKNWNGLTKEEIKLLQKSRKKVLIKSGIAFGPVFLIAFLLLIYFYFVNTGLWNSLW